MALRRAPLCSAQGRFMLPTRHSNERTHMASIIVEYTFEVPKSDEDLSRMAQRLDPCLEIRSGAWVRSSLSEDRKRMICEFEAPDAESVREALRSSGFAFDRAWPAHVFAVESYPEPLAKVQALRGKAG
jgi:hypothetical protein